MSHQSEFLIASGLAMLSSVVSAQRPGPPLPTPRPHFEVASIKRNLSGSTDDRMNVAPGGRFAATNVPVRTLIRNVYRVQCYRKLAGGPEWLATERWDILAAGATAANMDEMLQRVKALLQDRFKLAVHTEMRDAAHYALVMARGDRRLWPAPPAGPHGLRSPATRRRRLRRDTGGRRSQNVWSNAA